MRHRPAPLLLTVVLTALLAATGTAAFASGPRVTPDGLADLPALPPVMTCADVTGLDLGGVTDAPVTLKTATVVTTGAAPYCEVRGTIAPANTIVVRLPIDGWTQRYVQAGCGGLCGMANLNYPQASTCPVIADGTVAGATTDMGHQGQNDGSWAAGNPQAQIDFAYRGVHVTSQVAKAIITKFYGRQPVYSYFDGCSDGGREALMEAQRYPHDFDGIAAGAPASNMALQNTFHHAWNVYANLDADGKYILLSNKLPLIHAAVLAACDTIDGLRDGLVDDPRLCHFNPASIVCTTGQDSATCLTSAEATVVRKLHDGATDEHGNRLEPAIAHEWSSELDWTLFIPAAQGQTVGSEMFALSYLRYLAQPNNPNPDYKLSDLKFTVASFWKTMLPSTTYMAAIDPDLSAFQRAGGKLLLWHGWNDQHISPQGTMDYYDTMRTTMGAATVDRFAKLYLFPGVAHCGGGEGPNTFDILTPVMAWTESGRKPTRIVASNIAGGAVTRTRPVFPYPAVARYDGTGSIDDAANFVAYTPENPVRNDYRWVGQALYSHGYQTWPKAVDGKLVIQPFTTRH
ncbi:tannase/feruloyl esterase family alpha/beta hydrolase [Winogradskya humida]|uniref:Feruloyl esterase n=1 Tax=Winogradskya humida TaxID=113566 RepID=A0ABQ4A753_9ACTN|nr:tannase/feruloyl esterase family alpha/beta hydrolase [Actinoplanes humidus]GIE26661.1 hypothetical protein Ahu01nite_097630 [Actinoplanes humidus]